MCLDIVDALPPKKTSGFGYKVFEKIDKNIFGEYFGGPYELNTWYLAGNENGKYYCSWDGVNYTLGFHIFKTKASTKKWSLDVGGSIGSIYRVEYRGAHATGTQMDLKVIIASEMRIIKELK